MAVAMRVAPYLSIPCPRARGAILTSMLVSPAVTGWLVYVCYGQSSTGGGVCRPLGARPASINVGSAGLSCFCPAFGWGGGVATVH